MNAGTALPPLGAMRLLDQVRECLRYAHYSLSTERSYVHGVRAFVRFQGLRHPREMGDAEVESFLSWLANRHGASVSTHRQALSALVCLYRQVLGIDLPWLQQIGRPRPPQRPPVVYPRLDSRGRGRVQVAAELPLLYAHGRHPAPPSVKFACASDEADTAPRRARPSRLEVEPYLASLPVYRYRR